MAMMDWTDWKPTERAVLVFVRDGDDLLLIHKKRGLGTGKINGPGGRLEVGETWEQAGRREILEETGLTPDRLVPAAVLRFQFLDGYSLDVRAFLGNGWSGTLTECDEALPFWHPASALPWNRMWADAPLWLPLALEGRPVSGRFVFSGETMLEAHLRVGPWSGDPFAG